MNERMYNSGKAHVVARDNRVKPTCPFCGLPIERPVEPSARRLGEMPIGSCTCGAVYAYDATGHNLGAAFSEALVFGCDMDWDLAWNLLPEEDYLEALVENYDIVSNYIIPVGSYEGRRVSGALYFIRLQQDIQEVTRQGVEQKLDRARASAPVSGLPARGAAGKKYTKKEVEDLAFNYQLEPLLDAAAYDKKLTRYLQRLLYTGDELLRLRAADALGRVSAVIAVKDPGAVSNLLQKLLTSVASADYGASNWGAIDAIGEIIRNTPDIFAGYTAALYQFLEGNTDLRPGVLRALARIANVRPDLITRSLAYFNHFLQECEPKTRGYTALLIYHLGKPNGRLGAAETKAELFNMVDDDREIGIYENGFFAHKKIGTLAAQALSNFD